MKKIGYLFVTILLSLSCSDEKDCCSQIAGNNTLFEFSLVNQNGEDLLNENTQNSYNTNNIKLYNLIDGEEILINNPNSDSPNGYSIFEKDGLNLFRPFFKESNLEISGIIEWNPNKRDKISLEMVQQSENVKRLVKIKYNGEIVWNEETATNPDNRYFQIVM
jgi:hypothetical protein